eukprot:TRINITY_DN7872_c0_g1_i2.p1 TRINITY_DN7872_c0_g1~~TRINITY_DN7872_c0_g1_i2.p1  ORF type:complete len:405 (-),score=94.11 TRINITY_DN7872_c0_g1_i2:237-1370(-)
MSLLTPWRYRYIPEANMANLKEYRYSGTDNSIMSKKLQPFWNWAVQQLPETLAPNCVTFIGFFINLASYFVLAYYAPKLSDRAPNWTYLLAAISLFLYQTLDAIDGKQARRTKTSSPLGELVDHGCDAVSTHLISLNVLAGMVVPAGWQGLIYTLLLSTGFYLAQWEQYITGTLNLPMISGPTEGILGNIAFMLLSGVVGPEFWQMHIATVRGIEVTPCSFIIGLLIAASVGTYYTNFANGLLFQRADLGLANRLFLLYPLYASVGFVLFLCQRHPEFLSEGLRSICWVFGMLVSNYASRHVLFRVCRTPLEPPVLLVAPLAVAAALSMLGFSYAVVSWVVFLHALLLCVCYVHLSISVTFEFTKYLGIRAFSVPRK